MITTLGIAAMLFCIAVTLRAALKESQHGGQPMRESIAEAWTNIAIGFSINYAVNLVMLPMIGAELGSELTAVNNFWLGWVYTSVSFIRQMAIRRFYNWRMVRAQ